jgi:hypothetical protein
MIITDDDLRRHGCPYCGCVKGKSIVTGPTKLWVCALCEKECVAIQRNIKNGLKFLDDDGTPSDPPIEIHPRIGKPCIGCKKLEGTEPVQLIESGVYQTPGCFMCGGHTGDYQGILLRTPCTRAAEHIIDMFPVGAILQSPTRIAIGAANKFLTNLHTLRIQIEKNGSISKANIEQARRVSIAPSPN